MCITPVGFHTVLRRVDYDYWTPKEKCTQDPTTKQTRESNSNYGHYTLVDGGENEKSTSSLAAFVNTLLNIFHECMIDLKLQIQAPKINALFIHFYEVYFQIEVTVYTKVTEPWQFTEMFATTFILWSISNILHINFHAQ